MNTNSPYGFCPICGAPGKSRERRPNGNDTCENGHEYPSSTALKTPKKSPAEDFVKILKEIETELQHDRRCPTKALDIIAGALDKYDRVEEF